MQKTLTRMFLLCSLFLPFPTFPNTFTFGIVPQQSATKLARSWLPVIQHIEKKTGYRIKFATAPDIPEFERRLSKGRYDIAYMNPYHYTIFSKTTGYKAFAKQANKKIEGIIVVRNDSAIASIGDLNGKKIAFPAPAAFAATLLVQSHLKNNNVDFIADYVSSHDSVYRAVVKGLVPAGGGIIRTLKAIDASIRDKLKVLWLSKGFTPHAFAYHPRIRKKEIDSITQALLSLNNDYNSHVLERIKFNGVEPATDDDWDDVRMLGIQVETGISNR